MRYFYNPNPRRMPSVPQIDRHWGKGRVCFKCGMSERSALERSHIVPRCFGGSDHVSNIHLLCSTHHKVAEFWLGVDELGKDDFINNYKKWIGFDFPEPSLYEDDCLRDTA